MGAKQDGRCRAQWDIYRWPFVTRCIQMDDTKHDHEDINGQPPPKGEWFVMRGDETKRVFKHGYEVMPFDLLQEEDGGMVLACIVPHRCGRKFLVESEWEAAMIHVEAVVPIGSTQD